MIAPSSFEEQIAAAKLEGARVAWEASYKIGRMFLDAGDLDGFLNLAKADIGGLRRGSRGKAWETTLASLLRERGHKVDDIAGSCFSHDLIVDSRLTVQAKYVGNNNTAIKRCGARREGKHGYERRYHVNDFDILAIVRGNDMKEMFFMPTKIVAGQDGYLPTTLRPEHDEWRDRWDVFKTTEPTRTDAPLFPGWTP